MARVGQQAVNGTPFAYRNVMPSEEILKVATNGGARSLGLEKQIGSLEVGKKADILLIDRTNLDQMPVQDIYFIAANIVVGRDVKTVVIDGNVVMKDRELLTVDREEIDRRLAERTDRIVEAEVTEARYPARRQALLKTWHEAQEKRAEAGSC